MKLGDTQETDFSKYGQERCRLTVFVLRNTKKLLTLAALGAKC